MAIDVVPVDYDSPVGQIRALIGDDVQRTDPAFPAKAAEFLFSDPKLTAYLSLSSGSVLHGAAHALDALAINEALVSKKIRTEAGMQTDGPAVAKALQDTAKMLRAEGDKLADEAAQDFGFEVVDYQEPCEWPFNNLYGVRF